MGSERRPFSGLAARLVRRPAAYLADRPAVRVGAMLAARHAGRAAGALVLLTATAAVVIAGRPATPPAAVPAPTVSDDTAVPAAWSAYADSLGAVRPALLEAWTAAAEAALARAATVRPPYLETGRVGDEAVEAVGYRVDLLRGERLSIAVDVREGDALPFLDLVGATPTATAAGRLEHVASADGTVLVRLQPRQGAAAGYTVTIDRTAALTFPVQYDAAALLSYFYDPRGGGTRRHHGVDIGAPRGTPVVSAADGLVERVENTAAGGLVVWVRETGTGRTHYYAHLDSQAVRPGVRVSAGDVIGTVGTTGNAHSTAPHLHFGIYRDGRPLDPLFYLDAPDRAARHDDDADTGLVGTRVRTRLAGAALRTVNRMQGEAVSLPRHSELDVVAAAGRYYRVRTAAGTEGFLAAWLVEPAPAGREPRRSLLRR